MKYLNAVLGRVVNGRWNFNILPGSVIILSFLFVSCSSDKEPWNQAKNEGTIQSYQLFLKSHPNSSYADSAKSKLYTLCYKRALFPIIKDKKRGYIDNAGNIIIQPVYDYADEFKGGFALVKSGDFWGIINKIGEMVVPLKHKALSNFSEGLAMVKYSKKWGFSDTTGHKTIDSLFDDAWPFKDGAALVKTNNKWGVIDKSGKFIIEPKYEGAYSEEYTSQMFSVGPDGILLALILTDRNEIPIIKNDMEILTRQGYQRGASYSFNIKDWIDNFSEGYARVMIDNQWGFIDKKGNTFVKPQYLYCSIFENGKATVNLNRKLKLINTKGEFSEMEPQAQKTIGLKFHDGLASFTAGNLNNKYGFINKEGGLIIKPIYDYAFDFSDGLACVRVKDKFGYIDTKGDFVIKPQYSSASSFKNGLARVQKDHKYCYINKDEKTIWIDSDAK